MEVSRLRSGRLSKQKKKNYPFNAAWTSECSWRATVAPAGWTSSGLRGAPHKWMGRAARWHLSWPLADTTAQKKKTTFLDSCMSSLRLSMLFFSVSFKRETPRIMFVILTQGPCSPVLVLTWRSSYADTVGEGVKKLARAQANVPSRFQSRVQHANSIRLSHAVVHHRSSTIS